MKKIVLIFFLMIFTFSVFSNNQYFDIDKGKQSLKPAIEKMDTAKIYAEKIGDLLVREYKMWGLKKTIQVNANVFLPIALFAVLFLVWLKNKK